MKSGEFTILFAEGLHARPASELVRLCQKAKSNILLIKDDMTADPKSILGIMALGAAKDSIIKVEVDGEDEVEVFENLTNFFTAE
jgi:phosphocarrier protein